MIKFCLVSENNVFIFSVKYADMLMYKHIS